ncbi:DUF4258 domain-containing protein [Thermodesulfovibrio yellowstonii]|uniref:DUF4258 domain-containing protein n=1 Tax=Thermodesulfovibrio yellowstonii TaxID=28262 RepID=A0A9W6GGH4_9BACT|nr:DUF4258 domain-containing protein [Thermodesulfovibrio islandicus]GLI53489.1 hypothetical protein TISLANDTSLP1_11820 [Thermodesulfovibrio islandicus]
MKIEIIEKTPLSKGTIYKLKIDYKIIEIFFLSHAIERINKWQINEEMVIETLLFPEEVLIGHRGRYIAHKRFGNHVVRAIYEYDEKLPVLITVYFPYIDRYFKGGDIYEDKILK